MNDLQVFAAAPQILYYTRRSRELGKLASAVSGAEAVNVLKEKTAADAALYGLLEKTSSRLLENLHAVRKSPVAKGIGYGAGAAIPLGLLANYLMNDAQDRAESVYYPAAGALGIGAGLMGLSGLMNRDDGHAASAHGNRKMASEALVKTGSAAFVVAGKLASVVGTTSDSETRKLAQEALQVALAHVADVVGDLIL